MPKYFQLEEKSDDCAANEVSVVEAETMEEFSASDSLDTDNIDGFDYPGWLEITEVSEQQIEEQFKQLMENMTTLDKFKLVLGAKKIHSFSLYKEKDKEELQEYIECFYQESSEDEE